MKGWLVKGLIGLLALIGISNAVSRTTTPTPTPVPPQVEAAAATAFPTEVRLPTTTPTSAPVPSPTYMPTYHKGEDIYYPDVRKTPGSTFNVTAAQVCISGYSSSVRSVSESTRKSVFASYGIPYPPASGAYELDHFIPLELGGDNAVTNLWPESAAPDPGFHAKDQVENYLHKQVCNGSISLTDAQDLIKTDWYQVFLTMGQAALGIAAQAQSTTIPVAPTTALAPVTNSGGATGKCVDGSLTFAVHHQGACSHHGGVATWF